MSPQAEKKQTMLARVADENGVAVVTFDLPGEPVNKLTAEVMDEFAALLTRLGEDGMVRGVVLISGKPDNFIAGADIEQFTRLGIASQWRLHPCQLLARAFKKIINLLLGKWLYNNCALKPKPDS